ncbi:SAV_2336 N-terminal domain-related protein [Streptomyces roseicoloratus]|uniref:SAV_2336 N-terminal domain-related protein n=1 Tax=Streptomyces roseicoloratus TaxID=2508722 RepID=UPI001009B7DD|nr:SAV_2336 N-terminal domain-related protein [Streptomyces roseicoloratus]
MHRMHLEELTRRLRAGGQDPTAEELADAVWLAQWLPRAGADGSGGGPGEGGDPHRIPGGDADADLARDPLRAGRPTGTAGASGAGADRRDPATGTPATAAPPTPPDTPASPARPGETVDLLMPPPRGGGTAGPRGGRPPGTGGVRGLPGAALPVRAPGANALPGLLGLQKALRPLRHYASHLPARPGEERLDEEATAEHSAASGILTPVLRPAAGQRPDIQLLMDAGPAMVVWARMVEELRQACQQSGAFRDVQVHRLHDTGEGPPLVTTTSGPDGRPRLRPGDQLHEPTGRRLTLVVSDCVGPLWRRGAAQRLIHQWPRHSPIALVQPLPPRLWQRTGLSVEPGTLVRPATPGGHVRFEPDEQAWEPVAAGLRAVPVLTPTPEAFASWARLLTGHGGGAVRGWAARIGPATGTTSVGTTPATPATAATPAIPSAWAAAAAATTTPPTSAGAGAGAGAGAAAGAAAGPGSDARAGAASEARPEAGAVAGPGRALRREDEELLRAFRAGASPGAVRLAVHLAAAPLALPVMQLVQRAMLPDTGPMELAEVLLSGLLWRLPEPTPYPCFSYPPAVQEHLLGSLDRSAAALVLKHCSEFVERHFGQGMRNFPALAAARLAGHGTDEEETRAPGTRAHGPVEEDEEPAGAASELFARIPARVLRFYHPDLVTPEPLAAARRLLDQWRAQSDPSLLDSARALVENALAADGPPGSPAEIAAARLVLGQVLHAQAGTAAVRDRGQRRELLERAVTELVRAAELAGPDGTDRAEARLEQAAAQHALWRLGGDGRMLDAALAALAGDPADWPEGHRHALLVRRGRLLLARGEGAAAATAFTEALATEESGPVLLDLADAHRLAGSGPASVADALDRAAPLLGDSVALRLRWTTARARLYDSTGDGPAADEAYESATLLTPPEGEQRGRLLLTWGESLLRRAAAGTGTAPVDRAESVLREALTCLPARDGARSRARILIGSVLALRFDRAGFLPDLFESRHLLDEALRTAREPGERAEVWLQLGWVRLQLSEVARDGPLVDALTAYQRAADDTRAAHGDDPGTVTLARALHAQGAVLFLMGSAGRAAAVLRSALGRWRGLDAALVDVDWDDVERTRALLAETGSGSLPPPDRLSREERRRIAPPWWAWEGTDG